MIIPIGFGNASLRFAGAALPNGAAVNFGFQNTGPITALEAAEAFAASWNATWRARQVNTVLLQDVLVKLGPNATGPSAIAPDGDAGQQSLLGEPPQVAVLVQKITFFGGRRGRGRVYIPGVREDDVLASGLLDPAQLTLWQSSIDAFEGALTLAGIQLVVLHDIETVSPTPVESLVVSPRVATQRRRNRR